MGVVLCCVGEGVCGSRSASLVSIRVVSEM